MGQRNCLLSSRGAWNIDGPVESIWDRYSHTQGNVKGAWTGDVACDNYHRFPEDIAIMKQMNFRSYRYSSHGRVYSHPSREPHIRMASPSTSASPTPFSAQACGPLVTLFHRDLPQILEDRGGWPNRDTAARLVDYVEIVIFNNVWFLETALRGATRKPSFTALLSRPWASRPAMKNE